jgi:hypothetical protein
MKNFLLLFSLVIFSTSMFATEVIFGSYTLVSESYSFTGTSDSCLLKPFGKDDLEGTLELSIDSVDNYYVFAFYPGTLSIHIPIDGEANITDKLFSYDYLDRFSLVLKEENSVLSLKVVHLDCELYLELEKI